MTEQTCRWGILGTAGIARKNWKAIWNASNSHLVAVGSRTSGRAEQFIRECQSQSPFNPAPEPVAGYDSLIGRSDIDAVYIPLPTAIRKEWVIRAAEAGKHVLLEKPCGVSAADVKEMFDACQANNVLMMDGVMFMHSDRLNAVQETIRDDNAIGDLRRIATQFSFLAPEGFMNENIRVSSELEPLGCLGDLGWYNIRFILCMMDFALPTQVSGRRLQTAKRPDSSAEVPIEFSGEMFFENGVTASLYCAFITEHQQWANVSGTRGNIQINDFVLPFYGSELTFEVCQATYEVQGCDFCMQPGRQAVHVNEYSNSMANSQEAKMVHRFSQHVITGNIDRNWGDVALKTQSVLDALLKSSQHEGQWVAPDSL